MYVAAKSSNETQVWATIRLSRYSPRTEQAYGSHRGKCFAPVAKCARHPDKLVQEFFHPTGVGRVSDFAVAGSKSFPAVPK